VPSRATHLSTTRLSEIHVGAPLQARVSLLTRQQIVTPAVEFHVFDVLVSDRQSRSWRDHHTGLETFERIAPAVGCNAIRIVKITTADCLADVDRLHNNFVGAGNKDAILPAPCAMGIFFGDAPVAANKAMSIT
jgi:hypothetical protein